VIPPFLDFGPMPIANGFLSPEEVPNEKRYPLRVGFDPETKLVRLLDLVPPELLFHERYAFHSSTSSRMAEHFERFAESVKGRLPRDAFVVELGCNDGILLRHFVTMRHLGIEPSANVAMVAKSRGLRVVSCFFDRDAAGHCARVHGQADCILAANVMCHVPDPAETFRAVASLLRPPGLFIFEDPYLGDILRLGSFDQIYDEHASYFSLTSVSKLAEGAGLELVHVEHLDTHGGSMRYTLAHRGERVVEDSVRAWRAEEVASGLAEPETFADFERRIEEKAWMLRSILNVHKFDGKRIAAYGATSKSTTVANYARIGAGLIEYITDTTPGKQGKLSPGAHIPVVSHEHWLANPPDYALLFAWNHAEEILAKEAAFRERGGKFIVYVPEVRVL